MVIAVRSKPVCRHWFSGRSRVSQLRPSSVKAILTADRLEMYMYAKRPVAWPNIVAIPAKNKHFRNALLS